MKAFKFFSGLVLLGLSIPLYAQVTLPAGKITAEEKPSLKLSLAPVARIPVQHNLYPALIEYEKWFNSISPQKDTLYYLQKDIHPPYRKLLQQLDEGRKLQNLKANPENAFVLAARWRLWVSLESGAFSLYIRKSQWQSAMVHLQRVRKIHKCITSPETINDFETYCTSRRALLLQLSEYSEKVPKQYLAPFKTVVLELDRELKNQIHPVLSGELREELRKSNFLETYEFANAYRLTPFGKHIGWGEPYSKEMQHEFMQTVAPRISKEKHHNLLKIVYGELLKNAQTPISKHYYPQSDALKKYFEASIQRLEQAPEMSELKAFEKSKFPAAVLEEKSLLMVLKELKTHDPHKIYAGSSASWLSSYVTRIISRNQAKSRLTLVKISCISFRHQHGSFPKTLSQLVPKFLTAIPVDPYVGGEMKYFPKKGLLYFAGDDLKDNGGQHGFDDYGQASRRWLFESPKDEDMVSYLKNPPKIEKEESDPEGVFTANPFESAEGDPFNDEGGASGEDDPFGEKD